MEGNSKKEVLVLCCQCEHAKAKQHPAALMFTLVCRVNEDSNCWVGPHPCDKYIESEIPF